MPEFAPAPEFPIGQRVLVDAPGRRGDGELGTVTSYGEEDVGGVLVTRYVVGFGGGMADEFAGEDLVPV